MCQPVVFVDKYEWRKLHPLERIAMHRYWIEVGKMMGITGIPGTYDDVYAWANVSSFYKRDMEFKVSPAKQVYSTLIGV